MPTRIYRVSIAKENGLLLYSASVERISEVTDSLLAPIISAVRTAIEEATEKSGELQSIEFSNRAVQISCQNQLICYLVTNQPSRILQSALNYFSNQFYGKYHQILAREDYPFVEAAKFEDTKALIFQCFPFLESEEVIHTILTQNN